MFKSTSGDAEDALLGGRDTEGAPDGRHTDATLLLGRDAEDALLDTGVFKSTRGDLLDAGVSGSAKRSIDAGVIGRKSDAGVSESGLSLEDELDEGADERDEADADDDADGNNGGGTPIAGAGGAIGGASGGGGGGIFKSSLWSLIIFP